MQFPAVPSGSTPAPFEDALITTVLDIARRAARRIMPADDADDVAQEVAIAFVNKMSPDRTASSPPLEAVVRHMVRERAIDRVRRERVRDARQTAYIRDVAATSHLWMEPETQIEEEELDALHDAALGELPAACRAAYTLVREEERPCSEASRKLGIRRETVSRLVAKAERVLRRRLLEEGIVVPARPTRSRRRKAAGDEIVAVSIQKPQPKAS